MFVVSLKSYIFARTCGNSSVGRARPCQGRGRGFKSRFPLNKTGRRMAAFIYMSYRVYILYSESTNSFYKGQTRELSQRMSRHNQSQEMATKHGVPWQLIWSTEKNTRSEALKLEKKLKNLTRNRLITFILKYSDGVEGPDELSLLEKLSEC